MKKYILASASPRRKELLQLLDLDFNIIPADITENLDASLTPEENVMKLAYGKAQAITTQYPDHFVIGADTIVVLNGRILGKPHSADEAKQMLRDLSGVTHQVITGVSLQYQDICDTFCSTTHVTFHPLTEVEIEAYIATQEPFDKAGAYGIQGRAAKFIKGIDGDYFTVVGLPIAEIYQRLKSFR